MFLFFNCEERHIDQDITIHNKTKRVFGTDEVSENSSLEKLLILKFQFYAKSLLAFHYTFFTGKFFASFFQKRREIPNTN